MTVSIEFLGAAGTVTGSCFHVQTEGGRFLVDCGMFQGLRDADRRNRSFGKLDVSGLDAVLLTHAHLDHTGRLPRLVRQGFDAPIYATDATRDLARIVMLDSAGIQEESARRAKRRQRHGKRFEAEDVEPLYDIADAAETIELFHRGIRYGHTVEPVPGTFATFHDAGHILGSAFIELSIARRRKDPLRVIFSGDIGNLDKPIVRDPTDPPMADVVVLESTYGEREHRSFEATVAELRGLVETVVRERRVMLIPSFAIERAQELLYVLHSFYLDGLLKGVPVFLDSPMALDATRVFTRHRDCFDDDALKLADLGENPFRWGRLTYCRSAEDSMKINHVDGPAIVVAPSGMCTGGRIVHHLVHRVSSPSTLIAFIGYQAEGTLGRRLVDGAPTAHILGRDVAVRAQVETVGGFSGHAGQSTLLSWLEKTGPAADVFLVHGETRSRRALRAEIERTMSCRVHEPSRDTVHVVG